MASIASNTTGVGFGAYGSLMQGQQTADLLDNQANIQRTNATQTRLAAAANSNRQMTMATKVEGRASASYAAAGVDSSSGSVLAVLGASAANAELDRQNILHGGEVRAINYENQASLDELGAKHAIQASYFNALSSIAGGGSKTIGNNMGGGGGAEAGYETDYAAGDSLESGETMDMAGGAADAGGLETLGEAAMV